jgi:hypothetical protein
MRFESAALPAVTSEYGATRPCRRHEPSKICVSTASDQNERGTRRARAHHTIFCMIEMSFFA